MQTSNVDEWIKKEERRKAILLALSWPLTARQLGRKVRLSLDSCSHVLGRMAEMGLVACLNPAARSSRLYGLTGLGLKCCARLRQDHGLSQAPSPELPDIDWELYGWLCFRHRSAIIRVLTEPMQPSAIKRKLRQANSSVKISANNVRDVIRLFLQKGLVRKVFVRKKAHPRYELTSKGRAFQKLLIQAEVIR